MPHGILPRYEARHRKTDLPIAPTLWSEAKCMFLTLYRLTGKRDDAFALADEFITWPIGPGNLPAKPTERHMLGWIQQWDEGKYTPPNPTIVDRFEERWNNAFKDAYRKMGMEGVRTTIAMLEKSREGNLTRSVDLEYAKNTAWAGAEGWEKLNTPAVNTQQRLVGGVRIITPLNKPRKVKASTVQRQKRKQLAQLNTVEGEYREIE